MLLVDLYNILIFIICLAMEHSKNMAEGKVPFSHEGFGERCKKFSRYRYRVGRMAENVACSFGAACVAEVSIF